MSDQHRLEHDIKTLIIEALGLEDISADDIGSEQTLFGEGLGLDSVDALELGLAIQKTYGIKIDAELLEALERFIPDHRVVLADPSGENDRIRRAQDRQIRADIFPDPVAENIDGDLRADVAAVLRLDKIAHIVAEL